MTTAENLFHLKPLVKNFRCKLSTSTPYDSSRQIICFVSENNEILFRFTNDKFAKIYKTIFWFERQGKVIHDVCFDPTGTWLLVLCFDNTLHVVPALNLLDNTQELNNVIIFNTTEITSFVIPFVGPHECPNSKSCPNSSFSSNSESTSSPFRFSSDLQQKLEFNQIIAAPLFNENIDNDFAYSILEAELLKSDTRSIFEDNINKFTESTSNTTNQSLQSNDGCSSSSNNRKNSKTFLFSCTCPYPVCVTWWQTIDKRNNAIIGYSDGSICFVGLAPDCPFIGNTSIENCAISKLIICRDNNYENVSLLITTSTKDQWKLLLEQKSLKYVFPSDLSPTSLSPKNSNHNDWTFVLQTQQKNDKTSLIMPSTSDIKFENQKTNEETLETNTSQELQTQTIEQINSTQVSLKLANNSSTFSKSIFPAAKARLSLLKNLSTKKINAIKMKLSDAKSRFDEYISEDSMNSIAVIESPSTAPEILSSSEPYYDVQNIHNTYLLGALYSQMFSIYRMDLKLIPIFHYKIPKNCQRIVMSSYLLYSIQLSEPLSENENIVNKNFLSNKNQEDQQQQTAQNNTINEVNNQNNVFTAPNNIEICASNLANNENNNKKELKNCSNNNKFISNVGIISSAMSCLQNIGGSEFDDKALFGLFSFENEEYVINLHQLTTYINDENNQHDIHISNDKNDNTKRKPSTESITINNYVRLYRNFTIPEDDEFVKCEKDIIQNYFPKVKYDPCIVVTNKNTYIIEMNNEPQAYFFNAAKAGKWDICENFCKTFDLSFTQCVEYVGDCLLRRKKVTQALVVYNVAQIPPVRTALKLAMNGENYALMHLCAMALKMDYLLKSQFISNNFIKNLLIDCNRRSCSDILSILPRKNANEIIIDGQICSDFSYARNESIASLQMPASSQFHLSNLLVMALAEHSLKKKYFNISLWNFIATNTLFHTSMTSSILCQSGLFLSAILLAMIRGCCIDVFVDLVKVSRQEFGWYSEKNVLAYNLSEIIFCECITYMHQISKDYFNFILNNLEEFDETVLQRLEAQLNPFLPVYRPIISHRNYITSTLDDENEIKNSILCKTLIETYLSVLIRLDSMKMKPPDIYNALNSFTITYEDNQFAIKSTNFPPISVGYLHSACVIDGCAYFWGSSGIPCMFSMRDYYAFRDPPQVVKSLEFLKLLNLEVHAVKCGRLHSLILTNNGLYAFGSNSHGQLGINKNMQEALHPMLVDSFDGKNITILEAGQYHNAAVADDLLYTWGWGVYGQLGHGSSENVKEPKVVNFFRQKEIIQICLGQSHSMVLCALKTGQNELYVFGSNHFGQLGVSPNSTTSSFLTKSLVPVKVEINNANIRLIHTKFFCSFAVDDNNILYTWGLSPRALRLVNQFKRRANAKQKVGEALKKLDKLDDSKRTENICSSDDVILTVPSVVCDTIKTNQQIDNYKLLKRTLSSTNLLKSNQKSSLKTSCRRRNSDTDLHNNKINENKKNCQNENNDLVKNEKISIKVDFDYDKKNNLFEELKSETVVEVYKNEEMQNKMLQNNANNETLDHMIPQKVDISEISGEILQISSGLIHFALISSTSTLYTWGKNLDHQLGTEDKERKSVSKPTPVESIDNPLHVECGADFTIVLTRDYCVKAFGGNGKGQCARDPTTSPGKAKASTFFCLPATKRLMKLETNCIESPVNVPLPRPQIQMNFEPTRYMKCIPKFHPSFIVNQSTFLKLFYNSASVSFFSGDQLLSDNDGAAASYHDNYNGIEEENHSICSSLTELQNLSSNDVSPIDDKSNINFNDCRSRNLLTTNENLNHFRNYIHYCLYVFHGLYEPLEILKNLEYNVEYEIRVLMLNYKYIDAFRKCLSECYNVESVINIFEYFTKDPNIVPMKRKDLKYFIYHLLNHFVLNNLDIDECEKFLLNNIDYYLVALSYVLFFNTNDPQLEQQIHQKFGNLLMIDDNENDNRNFCFNTTKLTTNNDSNPNKNESFYCELENADNIFDSLSVSFKAIICQKLLQFCKK